jgi:tRNA wybutosine-synthesizing protein 4
MTRHPDACRLAKFIDIDFPDLMSRKRTTVLNTPELRSVFAPLHTNVGGHVLLESDMYCQRGCDLRNTADLERALSSVLDRNNCIFLFVAEVSITYMEVRFLLNLLIFWEHGSPTSIESASIEPVF